MEESLGVREVRPGSHPDPAAVHVDIVAVHGLGGDAWNTWTHQTTRTCWVRDLLQDRLPGARALVFGYNAKKRNHNAEMDFEDVASQLIVGLSRHRMRPEEKTRPIIFMAHSLGGLIVKKAVTLATDQASTIASCTRGFVFFATPHCGSSFAELAVVFKAITKIIDPPSTFLRDLCSNSPELQRLHHTFKALVAEKSIPCVSFYEGLKRKTLPLFKASIIVTRESATLGVDHEDTICLNADHSAIVRFKSADDDNFKIVLGKLEELLAGITKDQKEEMDKLARIDSGRPTIGSRKRSTQLQVPFMPGKYFTGRDAELKRLCAWLVEPQERPTRAVALFGLSGVGKTQLALKFATDHPDFYDYVFMVNCSTMELLRNDFTKISKSLKISDENTTSLDKMMEWLSTREDEHWLLIFDNANNLSDVIPYISRLVNAGQIIVTTQDARVLNNEYIYGAADVKPLSPNESRELLFARAGINAPQQKEIDVAETLLQELGHLPLAVDSAAAYINMRRKSIGEYANIFRKYQKDALDHRPEASSYDRSVLGALEPAFKIIDTREDALAFLTLLVFLDKGEVTEQFLRRGVKAESTWGRKGQPVDAEPEDRYVPEDLIELIDNEIRFDSAVEELISFSIITCTKRQDVGRIFRMHPLQHKCAKIRMSKQDRRKYATRALLFLAHAFPSDEQVLEKGTGELGVSYIPHIFYAYDNFVFKDNKLTINYFNSLATPNPNPFTPSEQIAKLILDANFTYGKGDANKNSLVLKWVDDLLEESSDLYLKARALYTRLHARYYESGDYEGGMKAAKAFLDFANGAIEANPSLRDELTNSQLGLIYITLGEHVVTEVSVDEDDAKFKESVAWLQGWSPLNPAKPSKMELTSLGELSRISAKVRKDHGDWAAAESQFTDYLDRFAVRRSQFEGWSAGDLAHVLMEQGRAAQAEDVLVKYLAARQLWQTPEERAIDRRSDTMYLEMLLVEARMLLGRHGGAEQLGADLLQRFRSFGVLAHFERFRYMFVLTALARSRHVRGDYVGALEAWGQALEYCVGEIDVQEQRGKWARDTFIPLIILSSMADCYAELGQGDKAREAGREAAEGLKTCPPLRWIPGLGTYWLKWLRAKEREEALPPYEEAGRGVEKGMRGLDVKDGKESMKIVGGVDGKGEKGSV